MYQFPHVENPHFYVFGTGGTGGFALEYLTRLFSDSDKHVTIDIYDGDQVEAKNLKRQNFIVDDLNKMKTTALIQRLNKQVLKHPDFVEHDQYIVDADELVSEIILSTNDDETPILISAVDNIATRRLINRVIDELTDVLPVIAIDSGNHNEGGQVVAFSNVEVDSVNLLGKVTKVKLPNMLQRYPEIDVINDDRDENPGLVSYCAEEAESKPQSMMANVRNGEIVASVAYQLANNISINEPVWHSNVNNQTTNNEKEWCFWMKNW